MYTQYHVKDKILDPYFPKHKLGIEIDKYDHLDRNFEDEQRRQFMIEEKLGRKIVRTNPDAPDFNIYRLINQVSMDNEQSKIKSTKKSLIDDLSKELLEPATELNQNTEK